MVTSMGRVRQAGDITWNRGDEAKTGATTDAYGQCLYGALWTMMSTQQGSAATQNTFKRYQAPYLVTPVHLRPLLILTPHMPCPIPARFQLSRFPHLLGLGPLSLQLASHVCIRLPQPVILQPQLLMHLHLLLLLPAIERATERTAGCVPVEGRLPGVPCEGSPATTAALLCRYLKRISSRGSTLSNR